MSWAAQASEAENEPFNIFNGYVFEWRSVWSEMAETLGVGLERMNSRALRRTFTTTLTSGERSSPSTALRVVICAHSTDRVNQHADFTFAYGAPAGPVAFVSTVKLRKAGFHAAVNTQEAYCAALQSFIDRKLLPPAQH